jgi:tripartite-type tricarboxylate transporter receptor subunit TctC
MPLLSLACAAHAQTYPSRNIRMIVPFAAGGGLDFVSRIAAAKLAAGLKQTVIVDNRPGASGNIGTAVAAKAPPDGYTLMTISNSFTVNPSIFRSVPYDPVKDFAPVSMLTSYMLFVVAHPSVPARTPKALIDLAKARSGVLTYASAGHGTTTHIAGELLAYMANIKLAHIPYKGSAPSLPAVISGEAMLSFAATAVVPHIRSGRVVLIAVTGAKRSPVFPDAPTVAEGGVAGYESIGWNALFAPAGTPQAVVQRLSDVVGAGLREADAMSTFEKQGLDLAAGSPESLATIVRNETARWAKLVKAAGIQPAE